MPESTHCRTRGAIQHYGAGVDSEQLEAAWDRALTRYRQVEGPAASFNVAILETLRSRWGGVLRPDTSMFSLLFMRPDTTGNNADERVEILWEADNRVRMALVRNVPRRGEERLAGPMTVTGDYTRPQNALPAVESLLQQLTDPTIE